MFIKIKYKSPTTKRLLKISQGDWVDLYADEETSFLAGEYKLIPLGVAMELPPGYEAHIVPRSSTYKNFGIIQANHFGVVDNSYCGDDDWWYLIAYALRDTIIHKNDKICQFRIIEKQPEFDFVEVELLGNKSRGGIGSTGTK